MEVYCIGFKGYFCFSKETKDKDEQYYCFHTGYSKGNDTVSSKKEFVYGIRSCFYLSHENALDQEHNSGSPLSSLVATRNNSPITNEEERNYAPETTRSKKRAKKL